MARILLFTLLLSAIAALPRLTLADFLVQRTPQGLEGTPTRPERATVEPYQPCGLLTGGSPPIATLTQCLPGADCTPKEPTCDNSDCPHQCAPKQACGKANPCPSGFSCTSDSGGDGVCERLPPSPSGSTSAPGARCGMILANCPEGQYCATTNPSCYSLDVCYGICNLEPVYKPSRYPSCGGFTVAPNPNACSEPNICIDDPRRANSCGMACDMPGICVK